MQKSRREIENKDVPQTDYDRAVALASSGHHKEALVAFDVAIRSQPDNRRTRQARASLLRKLLRGLATGGKEAWLGQKPRASTPPIVLTPGPSLSDYIVEDRR